MMTAEPYICIKGDEVGDFEWFVPINNKDVEKYGGTTWKLYADFEREKLNTLQAIVIEVNKSVMAHLGAYFLGISFTTDGWRKSYDSRLIGYTQKEYAIDSESSRLLKRAEFLKAVCEKEGVEWLPENKATKNEQDNPARDYYTKEEIDKKLDELITMTPIYQAMSLLIPKTDNP